MNDQYIPEKFSAERSRQVQEKGYELSGDVGRSDQLLIAAATYVFAANWADKYGPRFSITPPAMWPWKAHYWKGGSAQRMREKAGALTLAALSAQVVEYEKETP